MSDPLPPHLRERWDAYWNGLNDWQDRHIGRCPTCRQYLRYGPMRRPYPTPASKAEREALEADRQALWIAASEHVDPEALGLGAMPDLDET